MTLALANDAHYVEEVRNQYENYPYPPRDPEREKAEFTCIPVDSLECLNYYHYRGQRDFSKGFSALVAGGGTGDTAIMLAEQCREMPADIVYLDISEASMQVAQKRAEVRGLSNITWIHGSILDVPKLVNKQFDYINCCGVLHHLESPGDGLAALAAVLKDDGALGLMLYAKYGRTAVYQMQDLMRILNQGEKDMQRKIDHCKSVLKHLPTTNSFRLIQPMFQGLNTYGDAGVYDLLLHSHDVAYSVPELYAFLAGANLQLNHFFFVQHPEGNNLYQLESYIKDESLRSAIAKLSEEEKHAAAELIHGQIFKHTVYASKTKTSLPNLDDLDNVPFLAMFMENNSYQALANVMNHYQLGEEVICQIHHMQVKFVKTANAYRLFTCMDGEKSLREIFTAVRASFAATERKPTIEELKKEFAAIFAAFNLQDWMFLRHKSVPKFKTNYDIQSRMANRK